MVESIGICEKHELPLDANGDCELCRLSDMPSKAPPERSPWWALIIPLLILAAGAAWAYSEVVSGDEEPVQQGVQQPVAPAPEPAPEPALAEEEVEPQEAAAERVPPRSTPPAPEEIPTPSDFER
jgi:hypothetical protein